MELERKSLEDYRGFLEEGVLESLREAAEPLQGKRVLHINATPFGGGVAEILASLVPLMRDAGLDAHWHALEGDDPFFQTTKILHNALQGGDVPLTEEMVAHYLDINAENAADLEEEWDFVVVHDPQPAALVSLVEKRGHWIWRTHIELTHAHEAAMALLARYLPHYDATVYSLQDYVPRDIPVPRPTIIPPSIDPLSPKNRPMAPEEVQAVATRYDVDLERPVLCCVARFDPWKDPLGTLEVYRRARRQVRGLQFLFITAMALDDPEGWVFYERTARNAGEDPDIHLLTNMIGVGALEVNALQRASTLSILKSLREGFGLVVAEALWKWSPVVGSNVGGIPLQILDGTTGFLVATPDEAVSRSIQLLQDPELRQRMGEAGRAHVQKHFLIVRQLRDYLDLFRGLAEGKPGG